jgi:hypothetical protein
LYAIIQKYLGKPLEYPIVDDITYICHVDGDMMGRAFVWAGTSEKAHGQSFNIDNGDVWEFRNLWKSLSEYYNLSLAETDTAFTLDQFFADNESTWKEIVARFDLQKYTLNELLGQSAQSMDILMNNCDQDKKLGGGKIWIESR